MRPNHHTLDRNQVHRAAVEHLQAHLQFKDYKRKVTAHVLWSVLLAAVAVAYEGGQLAMDLFSARLPPRGQRALDAVIAAVSLGTFAFMAWQAATVVRTLVRNGYIAQFLGGLGQVCRGMPKTSICG